MTKELRETYQKIASDYHSKKSKPWIDFKIYLSRINLKYKGILFDIGSGNGRNMQLIDASLFVGLDLSFNLLREYIGPEQTQRVAGALPRIPFRKSCADRILAIAILHHLNSDQLRKISLQALHFISSINCMLIISVWRKWRQENYRKLIETIRAKKSIQPLINVHRPWHDSHGNVLGLRFYHYFTRKELNSLVKSTNFHIVDCEITGGRHNDANFFVLLRPK